MKLKSVLTILIILSFIGLFEVGCASPTAPSTPTRGITVEPHRRPEATSIPTESLAIPTKVSAAKKIETASATPTASMADLTVTHVPPPEIPYRVLPGGKFNVAFVIENKSDSSVDIEVRPLEGEPIGASPQKFTIPPGTSEISFLFDGVLDYNVRTFSHLVFYRGEEMFYEIYIPYAIFATPLMPTVTPTDPPPFD